MKLEISVLLKSVNMSLIPISSQLWCRLSIIFAQSTLNSLYLSGTALFISAIYVGCITIPVLIWELFWGVLSKMVNVQIKNRTAALPQISPAFSKHLWISKEGRILVWGAGVPSVLSNNCSVVLTAVQFCLDCVFREQFWSFECWNGFCKFEQNGQIGEG